MNNMYLILSARHTRKGAGEERCISEKAEHERDVMEEVLRQTVWRG